jgi:hypothetical protein
MTLISRDSSQLVGKTISKVIIDNEYTSPDLTMLLRLEIQFTDGTSCILRPDWRGRECYISEYDT